MRRIHIWTQDKTRDWRKLHNEYFVISPLHLILLGLLNCGMACNSAYNILAKKFKEKKQFKMSRYKCLDNIRIYQEKNSLYCCELK